jgi:hypothetical protein
MTDTFHLWRNGTEITPETEWDARWTESVTGVGEWSATVQNRDGVPGLDFHNVEGALTRDIMKMTYGPGDETDWVLCEGELITAELQLPVGFRWRRWRLAGSDWNTVPDLRLINVGNDQGYWVPPGGDMDLSSDDPRGPHPLGVGGTGSSSLRPEHWYAELAQLPDGGDFDISEVDTTTYVPGGVLFDAITGETNFNPSRGTMKSAISAFLALASEPIYHWIDPIRKVHISSVADMPACPIAITDVRAEWDGETKVGGRGLSITADRASGPEECYVDGRTDFLVLALDDPDVSFWGTRFLVQGSGWGGDIHSRTKRQTMFTGEAVTKTQRDALADTVTAYKDRSRYRVRITVGGRDDEGAGIAIVTGIRAGQKIPITDGRLPDDLNGIDWPIQTLGGSLKAGRSNILQYGLECGDLPQGQFSAQLATHERAKPASQTKPAPKHAIFYEVLNPRPGETQTLRSQARANDDGSPAVKGTKVHWEFVAVTDHLGADKSGNGETFDPEDTVTDENGASTTRFTAGSLFGVWYQIEASTPYTP